MLSMDTAKPNNGLTVLCARPGVLSPLPWAFVYALGIRRRFPGMFDEIGRGYCHAIAKHNRWGPGGGRCRAAALIASDSTTRLG